MKMILFYSASRHEAARGADLSHDSFHRSDVLIATVQRSDFFFATWYLYLEKKTLVAQTDKMGVFEMHILSLPTGMAERSTCQFLVVVVVVAKHIPVDFRLRNTYSSM